MRFYFRLSTLFLVLIYSALVSAQIVKVDLPKGLYAFNIAEDKQGNIWIGLSDGNTGGALALVQNDTLILKSGSNGIPSGSYHTSVSLPDGGLMFGGNLLSEGKPCLVWITNYGIDTIQIPISLSSPFINTISLVNNRDIWLGTASGVLVNSYGKWSIYTVNNGLPHNFINAIQQDFRGVVWIGTELGLAYYIDKTFRALEQTSRAIANVTQFYNDNKGYLWCGSRFSSDGISVFNGKEWETFSVRHGLEDSSSSIFFQDSRGTLWVGSCYNRSRGGLSAFDGKNWTPYPSPEFLAKPCVDAIAEDKNGHIWIGGSLSSRKEKGITVFDGKKWKKIGNSTELPADRVITFFSDSKGGMWVSSMEGLFVIR